MVRESCCLLFVNRWVDHNVREIVVWHVKCDIRKWDGGVDEVQIMQAVSWYTISERTAQAERAAPPSFTTAHQSADEGVKTRKRERI
jgi:hypothetical protein